MSHPSETAKLLPCPFCGSKNIDPEGWASTDRAGPACDDCAGTADTVELWNTRAAQPAAPAVPDYETAARALGFEQLPNGKWFTVTPSQHMNSASTWDTAEQIFDWWGKTSGNAEAPEGVRPEPLFSGERDPFNSIVEWTNEVAPPVEKPQAGRPCPTCGGQRSWTALEPNDG